MSCTLNHCIALAALWKEHYTACHEEPSRPAGTPATEGRARKGRRPSQDHESGSRERNELRCTYC